MKGKFLLSCLLIVLLQTVHAKDICGVYVNKTKALNEDQYLVIEKTDEGKLTGFYYGITDDFDEAREGYLPGFFVSEIDSIVNVGNSVVFTFVVNAANTFTTQVPLDIRTSSEAYERLKPWGIYPEKIYTIQYKGEIKGETIFVKGKTSYDNKTFVKINDPRIIKTVGIAKDEYTRLSSCDKIYQDVDEKPRMWKEELSLQDYISYNLKIQKIKVPEAISLTIKFVVKRNGSVDNVNISSNQKYTKEFEETICKIVKNSPAWIPGKIKTDNVDSCVSQEKEPVCTQMMFLIDISKK